MAQIDVTQLFGDPDFVDAMTVITRTPTVSSFGENIITETARKSVGCIQPASGKALQRLPESLRNANVSSFWFKGPIETTGDCKYPSIIMYRGLRYQVQVVFDWTNWGAGWSEGTCIVEKPAG